MLHRGVGRYKRSVAGGPRHYYMEVTPRFGSTKRYLCWGATGGWSAPLQNRGQAVRATHGQQAPQRRGQAARGTQDNQILVCSAYSLPTIPATQAFPV